MQQLTCYFRNMVATWGILDWMDEATHQALYKKWITEWLPAEKCGTLW